MLLMEQKKVYLEYSQHKTARPTRAYSGVHGRTRGAVVERGRNDQSNSCPSKFPGPAFFGNIPEQFRV